MKKPRTYTQKQGTQLRYMQAIINLLCTKGEVENYETPAS